MTDQGNVSLETFTSVEGTKDGVKVYFSYTASSVAMAYQAATFLCDRLDKPASQSAQSDDHICPIHGVPMKKHTQNGDTWYSHKLDDGTWCRGGAK